MLAPARYDEVADFYEEIAPDAYDDPPLIELFRLSGDITGLRLLDLACGHGRATREFARRGAQVTGVDLSSALLEKARASQAKHPLPVTYVHADASSPQVLDGQQFDGATCHFGLSDIDDLAGVAATVSRLVRPGGFFTFSILHPCFPGWETQQASPSWQPGSGYYQEGWWQATSPAHGLRPKVGANHRMLSTYLTTFAASQLFVEELAEPLPSADWLAAPPATGPVPVYFIARCRYIA
jgi:2-polyprenyl-3-methyl-5-hydroxy-6-metoxy-1,4-benzoquinol methylase